MMVAEAAVFLIIAYIMPGQKPDIQIQIPEATIEECWSEAREFTRLGVTKAAANKGAIATLAACRVGIPEGVDG